MSWKKKRISAEAPARSSAEKKEPAKKKAPTGNKKKILIAEDERPLAHALELKFAHDGFETHIAVDGKQALEITKKFKFNVILLDLIMPTLDGFAFLEAFQKSKSKIPIVVLSNLGQEEDIERAKKLGAKGYFVKSNTPIAEIVKKVRTVL